MSKTFIAGILLLFCCCINIQQLKAQNFLSEKTDSLKTYSLQGVWQLCKGVQPLGDGNYRVRTAPYMKVLSSDKSFLNLFMGVEGQSSVITALGTYQQTSDSTYVEKIFRSVTDPEFTGNDNEIKFKFATPNLLLLSFHLHNNRDWKEVWVRIVQPNVKQPEIMRVL